MFIRTLIKLVPFVQNSAFGKLAILNPVFQPLHNPPGFRRVLTQFFVEPVSVHDVKVHFVSPVTIEVFISQRSMPTAMQRILIGTRADLEAKILAPNDRATNVRSSITIARASRVRTRPVSAPSARAA